MSRQTQSGWSFTDGIELVNQQPVNQQPVAFVSSVGSIKLFEDRPTTDSDDIDSLSSNPKFLELVGSLNREKVDEILPVRCPDTTATTTPLCLPPPSAGAGGGISNDMPILPRRVQVPVYNLSGPNYYSL